MMDSLVSCWLIKTHSGKEGSCFTLLFTRLITKLLNKCLEDNDMSCSMHQCGILATYVCLGGKYWVKLKNIVLKARQVLR